MRRRPAGSPGFTLIEVVLVLVLLTMAVGLALPFFGEGVVALRGKTAGRRVVSFLNDARARAVNLGARVEVRYDFEGRSFRQVTGREGKERELARYDLPGGVKVTAVEVGGKVVEEGTGAIVYNPLGDSSGGALRLADDRGRRYLVTVGLLFAGPKLTVEAE